jgi:hypothetical protein
MTLQVDADEMVQRRRRRAARVGWVALGGIVASGLAGLLGPGPVSRTVTVSADGLVTAEHHRIAHHEADDSLVLRVAPQAVDDGRLHIELGGSWVDGVDLQSMSPEPIDQRLVPGGRVLEFGVERPGSLAVTIAYRADDVGRLTGHVRVADDHLTFHQFVLP